MAQDQGRPSLPPPDLATRDLPILEQPSGEAWFRIGKTVHSPLHYTQSDGWRFSAPQMPGVLYLGDNAETCFWEVFWDDLVSRAPEDRHLDRARILERSLWELSAPRPWRLIDTTQASVLRALGAHGGTFSGPYEICQQWAGVFREHPAGIDGILYESTRHKPQRCLALFAERTAADPWSDSMSGTPLVQVTELAWLLRNEKYHLLRS